MLKFILWYLGISAIIFLKHFIDFWRCMYVAFRLEYNIEEHPSRRNYNYITSVRSLLSRAYISSDIGKYSQIAYDVDDITDRLFQARGIYRDRMLHSPLWGYNVLKKIHIFSPIFERSHGWFVSTILCLAEGLALYLIGLYLDNSGIGKSLLSYLISLGHSLIDSVRTLL